MTLLLQLLKPIIFNLLVVNYTTWASKRGINGGTCPHFQKECFGGLIKDFVALSGILLPNWVFLSIFHDLCHIEKLKKCSISEKKFRRPFSMNKMSLVCTNIKSFTTNLFSLEYNLAKVYPNSISPFKTSFVI